MPAHERMYFDNAASTPMDPRVLHAVVGAMEAGSGNPSSLHREGRAAREAIEGARRALADLVGARPGQVIFTPGGTCSDNLAILGTLAPHLHRSAPSHMVSSAIEHPAVLECCRWLNRRGVEVTLLPVDFEGRVDPDDLREALRPETRLVSVMAANHLTGVLQPIRELATICSERAVPFHTDAVQAVGKVPIDVGRDHLDLVSFSGHKIHGPKGIGALIVNDPSLLAPFMLGGGQESGIWSGTENTPAIVGFGEAARIILASGREDTGTLVQLRERLIEGVLAGVPGAYVIGHRHRRLPGHACFGFAGQEGEAIKLMLALDDLGVAVSTGSACSANRASEPSHVLTAMGFDPFRARGAFRVTLGRFNTAEEVNRFLDLLPGAVRDLRPITVRSNSFTGAFR